MGTGESGATGEMAGGVEGSVAGGMGGGVGDSVGRSVWGVFGGGVGGDDGGGVVGGIGVSVVAGAPWLTGEDVIGTGESGATEEMCGGIDFLSGVDPFPSPPVLLPEPFPLPPFLPFEPLPFLPPRLPSFLLFLLSYWYCVFAPLLPLPLLSLTLAPLFPESPFTLTRE